MIEMKKIVPASLPAPVQPEVQHEEPQTGGSFTRNLDTGALADNAPAPADKPEQE